MITRKEIAALSALLTQRRPAVSHNLIDSDALTLVRLATSQTTNATNLCNVPDYEARYDRKRDSLYGKANALLAPYALRAETGGDPRACGIYLFSTNHETLRGNTWGGDESGYGI